jgi:hypothetical protein
MQPQLGYYSLIQFCPDTARLETLNVGVVLFCPGIGFLDVKLADNDSDVRRVFGKERVRPRSLRAAKQALAARLTAPAYRPRTLEEFQHVIDTRANDLLLTPPRPLKVRQPADELNDLFRQLVERKAAPRKPRAAPLDPALERVFQTLVLQGLAEQDVEVPVPVLGKRLHVPYAYGNGVLNLVKPQRFSPEEATATKSAMQLAVEGDMIDRHGEDEQGKKRLVVVASFSEGTTAKTKVRERVLQLLSEYPVKTVPPEEVAAYAEEVRREAAHR